MNEEPDRAAPDEGSTPGLTPSQTIGPFFHYALSPAGEYRFDDLVTSDLTGAAGERIRIEGRIVDGDGQPVTDALIEIWQADADGCYPARDRARSNATFQGFGRAASDHEGRFWFTTVKPGRAPGPDRGLQAPHVAVNIFARGLLRQLVTRCYFDDEASANGSDPILALVPQERRGSVVARRQDGAGKIVYRFDIRLQGEGETVFFEPAEV